MSDKPDDLVTLTYFSSARQRFDDASLLDLLQRARRHNEQTRITGLLLYHQGNFVQALEGPRDAVHRLFERIRGDARHGGVISAGIEIAAERQFPHWSMGFVPSTLITLRDASTLDSVFGDGARGNRGKEKNSIAVSLLKRFREGMMR